jgi:hypothetical protein
MFVWLMRVIGWLLSLFHRRKRSGAPGLFGGGGYRRPEQPRDPLAGVRHPVARRPGGNSAAVAVEEPDDDESLTLVGASR